MNYIWELAIKAIEQNIDPDEIFYKYGIPFSPYMELSFPDMNQTKPIIEEVEINPYYRYYSIFKELFDPDLDENEEFIGVIHNNLVHHLKDIDVFMGMCKREYHINFIIKDIKDGCFGDYISENINVFSLLEKKILANNILYLYETGENIFLLKETIKKIFINAYILSNREEKDEVVFFLRTNKTTSKQLKIEIIRHIFLPFKFNILIYWDRIFGVMGVSELMKIGETMNY